MNGARKDERKRYFFDRVNVGTQLKMIGDVIDTFSETLSFTDALKKHLNQTGEIIDSDELARILDKGQYNVVGLTITPHGAFDDKRYLVQGTHIYDGFDGSNTYKSQLKLVVSSTRRSIVNAYNADVSKFISGVS